VLVRCGPAIEAMQAHECVAVRSAVRVTGGDLDVRCVGDVDSSQRDGRLLEVDAVGVEVGEEPIEGVHRQLVALEALLEFSADPRIRNGIVNSIVHQQSPLLQLALTDAILQMKDKDAIELLKNLLARKDLNFTVRERITETINILI